MLVPTMALQLSLVAGSENALSSLKAMTVGGGPMNERALENAERHLDTRFLRVFGMSECLGHTTPLPSDPDAYRLRVEAFLEEALGRNGPPGRRNGGQARPLNDDAVSSPVG